VQWKELREFGFSEAGPWQQPFHTQVPRLPVRKRKRTPYAAQTDSASSSDGGDGRPAPVPAFLPPFPPAHTYQSTAVAAVKRTSDASVMRQERVQRKQDVAKSLTAIAGESVLQPSLTVVHCYTFRRSQLSVGGIGLVMASIMGSPGFFAHSFCSCCVLVCRCF